MAKTPFPANPVRDALTPEALSLIAAVHQAGSMAGAARTLGLVPSALTYRIRVVEDALDVLLFDRSSRQARLTAAGQELLREGGRLLVELDAVANRVKRVATGWEPQLTLAVDSVLAQAPVMELCEAFFALAPPTRLKVREEALSGTLEALSSGQADLAIGVALDSPTDRVVQSKPLGTIGFVFVVAPQHPLARAAEPVSEEAMLLHRVVAVADSIQRGRGMSVGLLKGQDIFTVPGMQHKLDAQLRGLGAGFLPEYLARPHIEAGRLVQKKVERAERKMLLRYAWRSAAPAEEGRALQWWLAQLARPATQKALLGAAAAGG